MLKFLFGKEAVWSEGIFFLRVWCGVIFIYHGLICFDDEGMSGFARSLGEVNIPFPLLSAYLCKTTEFFGGICLVIGFLSRLVSMFMIVNMFVATFIFSHGLVFDNGHTTFILLICSLTIFLSAPDRLRIDRYVTLTLLLALMTACSHAQQTSLPQFDQLKINVCNSPGSVEAGDFNNDNLPDLVIVSETDSSATILLAKGNGQFEKSPGSPFYAGNIPNDITIGDLEKDGTQDLVFANHEKKYLTILMGDGSGKFTPAKQSPLQTQVKPHTHGVALGDFDGDGWLDVVTDSWGNDQLEVFFGDQKGFFESDGIFLKVGKRPYQRHRVADVNGDNIPDIIVTNLESNNVTMLLSDGRRNFYQPPGSPVACGDAPFGIAIGDVNADGKLDLAVINSPSSTGESKGIDGLTILIGTGEAKFKTLTGSPFPAGKIPNRVAIGDVNGDGVNDIVTSDNGRDEIYLFLMNSKGVMSGGSIKVGRHPKGIAIADVNGDGRRDIIVCNNEDDTISILMSKW